MFKFTTILVIALAVQASYCHIIRNKKLHQRSSQTSLAQIRVIGNDASKSVESLQIENQYNKRVLRSEANELAHQVHEVAYYLEQYVNRYQTVQGQQDLQQVATTLNDVVHTIQKSLHQEPSQLKSVLKEQLKNVVSETETLASKAVEEDNHYLFIGVDLLISSIRGLIKYNGVQTQNQQEIKNIVQTAINEVSNTIQSIDTNKADFASPLAHLSQYLSHRINRVVDYLHVELYHLHGEEVKKVVRGVVNKLIETRNSLEQVQEDTTVSDVKNQLKTNVHNVGAQIERLVQVAYTNNLNQQEARDLKDVVYNALARAVTVVEQLQKYIKVIVENNEEN